VRTNIEYRMLDKMELSYNSITVIFFATSSINITDKREVNYFEFFILHRHVCSIYIYILKQQYETAYGKDVLRSISETNIDIKQTDIQF
jgi:hypothetical protein